MIAVTAEKSECAILVGIEEIGPEIDERGIGLKIDPSRQGVRPSFPVEGADGGIVHVIVTHALIEFRRRADTDGEITDPLFQ